MNCAAVQAVLTHSRSANAARMVLLVLASHSNERGHVGALPIAQLCQEANASERTVKYAIRELRDELKELATEREGAGRGHTFDFDISPLLEKVQNLHASDKRATVAPIPEDKPEAEKKGADSSGIGAKSAPLSDPKGADFTGTKVAPSKALRTSTDKEHTHTARAKPADAGVCVGKSRFSFEQRKAHAAKNGLGDGWLTNSRDGRYDEIIADQLDKVGATAATVKSELTPEESQSLITKVATMLREGADIADVDRQLAPKVPRSQWATIRSAAQAQAKVGNVQAASHSPPPKAANVVPMRR